MFDRVVFRTEASASLGIGHLKRCITVARVLTDHNVQCIFAVCKDTSKVLENITNEFEVFLTLPCQEEQEVSEYYHRGSDLIIADSYNLDLAWEKSCDHLVVIDDLNRTHSAMMIVDQNFRANYSHFYSECDCITLLGPQYAILDPVYIKFRDASPPYLKRDKNILVAFGGSRQEKLVSSLIEAAALPSDWRMTVILGAGNRCNVSNKQIPRQIQIIESLPNLADVLSRSQLAVGAGGTTTWERMCIGVPSIVVTIAENQSQISKDLAEAGYILNLGAPTDTVINSLSSTTNHLIADSEKRLAMHEAAIKLVDGAGVD